MRNESLASVQDGFRDVLREGAFELEHDERAGSGNAYAEYVSSDLRLRLLTDHGVPRAEVAGRTEEHEWFELYLVEILLGHGDVQVVPPLGDQAAFLRRDLDKVRGLFSPGRLGETAVALGDLRERRNLARHPEWFLHRDDRRHIE